MQKKPDQQQNTDCLPLLCATECVCVYIGVQACVCECMNDAMFKWKNTWDTDMILDIHHDLQLQCASLLSLLM